MESWPPVPTWISLYGGDGEKAPPPPTLPEPEPNEYKMFGAQYQLELAQPDLESQGREALIDPDSKDISSDLKRLNAELLSLYSTLLKHILAGASEEANQCLQRIELIFINLFHATNSFRPQQARSKLIAMMQSEIERKQLLVDQMTQVCSEIEKELEK